MGEVTHIFVLQELHYHCRKLRKQKEEKKAEVPPKS